MGKYDDIIHLPRPVSAIHRPMDMAARAAQFAPFAALSGHDDAISEAARWTAERVELTPDELSLLSRRIEVAMAAGNGTEAVDITYFRPDRLKRGGAYVTATGPIIAIDPTARVMKLAGGTTIPLDDICAVDSPLFRDYPELE